MMYKTNSSAVACYSRVCLENPLFVVSFQIINYISYFRKLAKICAAFSIPRYIFLNIFLLRKIPENFYAIIRTLNFVILFAKNSVITVRFVVKFGMRESVDSIWPFAVIPQMALRRSFKLVMGQG